MRLLALSYEPPACFRQGASWRPVVGSSQRTTSASNPYHLRSRAAL